MNFTEHHYLVELQAAFTERPHGRCDLEANWSDTVT